jgi:hypothetical protein
MKPLLRFVAIKWVPVLAVAAATLLSGLHAAPAAADPPSRVGRVSYTQGTVSFYQDRNEGWRPARINYPVTSENSIWTEGAARAELRFGASAVRLDDNTILDFVRVGDDRTQAFLQRGSVNIRTRQYGNDGFRDSLTIETGEGRYVIDSNGRFRLDSAQDGTESRFTVFNGRARFEGNDNIILTVEQGKTLVVQNARPLNFRFETAREIDFDRWAMDRDIRWDETHTRYVREQVISPYMTGYEELDYHGEWIDDREYGRVWTPRYVATGWAPYRHGSWTYVSPWGWTWVDDAPWGFAPFHYGRWVTIGSRWCWWPGRYHHRPAYAPALVAWYDRPGLSVSVASGSVGWFPLAPHEHFMPRYTNNVTYIRNINYVTNNITVLNPPQRYANSVPGATFVNQTAFVQSKPIASNLIRANQSMIAAQVPQASINMPPPVRNAPVMGGGRSIAPVYVAPRVVGSQAGGEGASGTKPAMMPSPPSLQGSPGAPAFNNGRPSALVQPVAAAPQPPVPPMPPTAKPAAMPAQAPAVPPSPVPQPQAPVARPLPTPVDVPAPALAGGQPVRITPPPASPVSASAPVPMPLPAPIHTRPNKSPAPIVPAMPNPVPPMASPVPPMSNPVRAMPTPVPPMPSPVPTMQGERSRMPQALAQHAPQVAASPSQVVHQAPRHEPRHEPRMEQPRAVPQNFAPPAPVAQLRVHQEQPRAAKPQHERNKEGKHEGGKKPAMMER